MGSRAEGRLTGRRTDLLEGEERGGTRVNILYGHAEWDVAE